MGIFFSKFNKNNKYDKKKLLGEGVNYGFNFIDVEKVDNSTQIDIKEKVDNSTQIDIKEKVDNSTQIDIKEKVDNSTQTNEILNPFDLF